MTETLTAETAMAVEPQDYQPLVVASRCDGTTALLKGERGPCPSQALVRVMGPSGVLDFCGHHYHRYEPALSGAFVIVEDVRESVNQSPASGSVYADDLDAEAAGY